MRNPTTGLYCPRCLAVLWFTGDPPRLACACWPWHDEPRARWIYDKGGNVIGIKP